MMRGTSDARLEKIYAAKTQKRRTLTCRRRRSALWDLLAASLLIVSSLVVVCYPLLVHSLLCVHALRGRTLTHHATVAPFNPDLGAILPTHRVVAFYAIPNAEVTGPAYELTSGMLVHLQKQGAAYQRLDPTHPVQLGIDLVASVPDRSPGPDGYYSHHLDPATIRSYISFCQQHNLILFLDLDFGRAPIMQEVDFFLPYLERYAFVQMAVDPEWMFPRHNGIPGINLSNVRASDLNPIIQALAALPLKYHVPRKILLIHQYRPDGDGLRYPYAPGVAEIADKRDLLPDTRVDVVIHVDGVGGYDGDKAAKTNEYHMWVDRDMQKYHKFRYGGFKLFYHIEARTGLMTPRQVLALKPAPLVVTYGN